jgi:hypothetical protein
MSDDEQITVGAVSAGGEGPVDLPVVELLTGRGFVTGKSGSGKSNTASVVAEKLLDGGYGLLIVDIDGEYYGLKEEYEILHVGADEECDIQVGPQHAERIAQLALEKHVPIILDVSSFLDETKANELLTEVARHLFAKEKKLKQPFLLVVEEVHEYLPEGGGLDECGRMLIKVAKRGRKHGLGMCGISQRPADVKKDFITQCDWLVWHRLTWQNDTKVVSRILGSDYAAGVEELNDGEGYLMTDWDEHVRQVQFQRKRTFDAGATPGLDDFERPELKSVSDDLVSDLERITEDQRARESRIQELERELKDRDLRIEELEDELAEARDLSDMAERFSRAMMAHATGRPFREDVTGYQSDLEESTRAAGPGSEPAAPTGDEDGADGLWALVGGTDDADEDGTRGADPRNEADAEEEEAVPPDEHARPRPEPDGSMTGGEDGPGFEPAYEPWPDEEDMLSSTTGGGRLDAASEPNGGEAVEEAAPAEADDGADILVPEPEASTDDSNGTEWDGSFDGPGGGDILVPGEVDEGAHTGEGTTSGAGGRSGENTASGRADCAEGDGADPGEDDSGSDIIVPGETDAETPDGDAEDEPRPEDEDGDSDDDDIIVPGEDDASPTSTGGSDSDGPGDPSPTDDGNDGASAGPTLDSDRADSDTDAGPLADDAGAVGGGSDGVVDTPGPEHEAEESTGAASERPPDSERPVVREIRETVEGFDAVTRGMLAYYRSNGPVSPLDAHVAAGGDGDRTRAYGRNRKLREAGLVAHAGRGRYGYALRSRIDEAHDGRLDPTVLEAAVERVEESFLDRPDAPWPTA